MMKELSVIISTCTFEYYYYYCYYYLLFHCAFYIECYTPTNAL